jgi:hypothetical protein
VHRWNLSENGPALKGHLLPPFQGWLIIFGLIQGRRVKARLPLGYLLSLLQRSLNASPGLARTQTQLSCVNLLPSMS